MKNIVTGIDIGTHSTKVIVCEYNEGRAVPRVIATGESNSNGLRNGYILQKEEATESLRQAILEAERSSGIKIKQAYASVGGISLQSTIIKSAGNNTSDEGEVTSDLIRSVIEKAESKLLSKLKNRRILHTIPLHYLLDGNPVLGRPLGMRGEKLEIIILFVTCLDHHFADLIDTIEGAGVSVIDIAASPLATSNAILTPRQKAVGSMLLDIGAETVSLAVFENGNMISLEVFPIGSGNITNDLALGFQIPLEEAERIKVGTSENPQYSKKQIDEIIEARLSDVFELVEDHLKKIKRNEQLPAGIIITGGGSTLAPIEAFAKSTLKLPTRVIHADNLKIGGKMTGSSWFTAYGLCFLDREKSFRSYTSRGDSMGSFTKKAAKGLKSFLGQFLP